MTLTVKQLRVLKNMTAMVLVIISLVLIGGGIRQIFTGDIFNAVYSMPKIIGGILGIFVSIFLKYTLSITK